MSYTVPSTTTLGEVLGLQFNDAPGIATRQNANGTWELVSWPVALGSAPTQQQVDGWVAEIATARRQSRRAKIKAALRDNSDERQVLRSVVRVLMASLVEARRTINDLRAAMVNATSFADQKTRATAIPELTSRSWNQALNAAEQVIDAGQAEE